MKSLVIPSHMHGRCVAAVSVMVAALGTLVLNPSAFGAVEDIKWQLAMNQPMAAYYPNELSVDYQKRLEFNGTMENPTDLNGSVTMFFGYTDPTGRSGEGVHFTDPVTIDIPEFTMLSVTNTETLPYCPAQVSLHMRSDGAELIEVVGTFTHECLVPEPSTGLAAVLGLATMGLVWRVRR